MLKFTGKFVVVYIIITALTLVVLVIAPQNSSAQSLSTIRDDEIERYLQNIAKPVFKAAGLNADHIRIIIINDPMLNAFVAGGQNIFINTGLLLESDNPEMLIGVVAHESGHITGGHLIQKASRMESAGIESALGYILGIASIAAGAPPEAGIAIAQGGQHIAQRGYLKHSRTQEEAADQAALGYMRQVGASPDGLIQLLEKFHTEHTFYYNDISPYIMTHPLSSDRIEHLRNASREWQANEENIAENHIWLDDLHKRHSRVTAKLSAFLKEPKDILKKLKHADENIATRYARAIAYYRIPDMDSALREIDSLIDNFPDDPYFHELKGQMLFENGRIDESIASYRRAVELLPDAPLPTLQLAVAQIATEREELYADAAGILEQVLVKEPKNVIAWRQLGIAYGRMGKLGKSYLALAEEASLLKNNDDAEKYIELARKHLPEGTPAALKAKDILDSLED